MFSIYGLGHISPQVGIYFSVNSVRTRIHEFRKQSQKTVAESASRLPEELYPLTRRARPVSWAAPHVTPPTSLQEKSEKRAPFDLTHFVLTKANHITSLPSAHCAPASCPSCHTCRPQLRHHLVRVCVDHPPFEEHPARCSPGAGHHV